MRSGILVISFLSLLACSSVDATGINGSEERVTPIEENACWFESIGIDLRIGDFSQSDGRAANWIIFRGRSGNALGKDDEVYATITEGKKTLITMFNFDMSNESIVVDQDNELNVFVTMRSNIDRTSDKKYKVVINSESKKLDCLKSSFWK